MNILTINAGSSSLKSKYFQDQKSIISLLIQEINSPSSQATLHYNNQTYTIKKPIQCHTQAISILQELYNQANLSHKLQQLDAIAHRVVHGGDIFYQPTLIDKQVIDTLKSISHLAPLHNPINIEAIEIFANQFSNIAQVAIFDTAFHHSIPAYASTYALPQDITSKHHIKRYGFHGTSYAYTTTQASKLLQIPQNNINLISMHLGNGASITAILNGKSIDTSMGMTPLAGLVMGSRCGDIDAAIIPYLHTQGYDVNKIDDILNHQSGLVALCGTNDMREIESSYHQNNPKAIQAIDIYTYQIAKYIGSYATILGDIDAIVFSGGIGENSSFIRAKIIDRVSTLLNLEIDQSKNTQPTTTPTIISTNNSSIPIAIIPTDEELQMAVEVEFLYEVRS